MVQHSADNYSLPPIIELSSVDSTNNYALSLLKEQNLTERQENMNHGTTIFAHEQFAGKGQRGKTWQSQKGENVHMSIILNPEKIELHQQFLLIAIVALAVRDFLESYAQSDICIKWPNDIYFKDRKAGGILIENIINGTEWKWAIAGIGLNINQTKFDSAIARKAVSLKQITGKQFNCLKLSQELRAALLQKYERFTTNDVIEAYNSVLYKKNQLVTFEKDGQQFKAIVKKVLPNGQLVVETDIELRFDFGELIWVV